MTTPALEGQDHWIAAATAEKGSSLHDLVFWDGVAVGVGHSPARHSYIRYSSYATPQRATIIIIKYAQLSSQDQSE